MANNNVPKIYQPLADSERLPAADARLLGPADPHETLSVTIVLRRRPDAPPMPKPAPGAAMSRQEFAARHGASDEDLQRVEDFARSHHLTVVETHAGRRTVVVSGTVAQMNAAFGVDLQRYERAAETYRGREGFIHVPAELADIILGVFGLDNRTIGGQNSPVTAPSGTRANTGGGVNAGDPPNTHGLTVPQVAQFYNFPTNSAAGQTIGLIEVFGGYQLADIQSFFNNLGLTTPTITDVGTNSPGGGADGEVVLDICIAAAVAQGAAVAVYFDAPTQAGWVNAITRAVHPGAGDPTPSVISISDYITNGDDSATYLSEGVTLAMINAVSAAFQDAAAVGVSVFIASGDTGSDSKVGDGNAHVQYPGSDPWITSCGGTTIGDVSGSSFTEIAWNDVFQGFLPVATGGGVSSLFALPDYQAGASVPASVNPGGGAGRGVPDIAGNASPNSGYDIWVGGSMIPGGGNGTSAVAPLYAGLAAVYNASLGHSVGFLNPLLYALNGTGVIRDIADGGSNALNGAPGYTCGAGWDGCTGLGVINGTALLGSLQARFTKAVTIITDRSTFGQDEVTGMLQVSTPAVITAAFYVTVDGFTPADLGITSASPTLAQLQAWAPPIVMSPSPAGMSIKPTDFKPELLSLPAQPQRFTFIYEVSFQNTSGFTAPILPVTLTATTHAISGQAAIELIESPNPFMIDGPVSWLSTDLRVFQIRPGQALMGLSGVTMGGSPSDASTFITGVINGFNGLGPINHPFDLISTDENTSHLELSEKVFGVPVFNFAVCRVRIHESLSNATDVRVFFRIFQASTTNTTYDPTTTYLSGGSGSTKVPLLGLVGGALETIPCFAAPRINSGTASLNTQTDPANVQTFVADGSGQEQDFYFGCWLDINQPGQALYPALPPNATGPFGGSLQSLQQLVRNLHQCLVAEIAYDPDPIPNGTSPGSSDKLAQRNLSIVESDNPGSPASHRIVNTFDVKATRTALPAGWHPDELMIDWGNTPVDSTATLYLPGVDAGQVLEMSAKLYGLTTLTKVDGHTLTCPAGGMTWLPLPPGTGPNYAGLMTIDLPSTVKRGQAFKVVVKQVTSGLVGDKSKPQEPVPIPERRGGARNQAALASARVTREARRIDGGFQVTIPVTTKAQMLPAEERAFSVLSWIEASIPQEDRWRPVFDRYVKTIGERVAALGGDPSTIKPSPDGSGVPSSGGVKPGLQGQTGPQPAGGTGDARSRFTGKVEGLIYDRYGDFAGFQLDTEAGARRFECRESEIEDVVRRAWAERVLTTVVVKHGSPHHPEEIILHSPPPPYRHGH